MSDEKQSPFGSPSASMASNFLHTSSDHRNISSPSPISSSFGGIAVTGYPFSDLGLGHGSPKSTQDDMDAKDDSKLDMYSDGKGLNLAITLPFQESEHSVTSTPSQFSQILSFRPTAVPGDAMLSAINYNENDILPESLDIGGSLPNLDDGILSNMGAPGDLFDGEGNVNDPYSMDDYSPPSSHDFGGFGSDGYGGIDSDHGLSNPDPGRSMEGFKQQKKTKSQKPAKGQTSPARLNSLQCPTCGKTFTNSSALAKHRLTHSDERKYVCNLCQKAFKRQDHLNGHLMTHREKKPYECSVDNCTKSYCDARSLRRHLENHHNQTPEQIHSAIALVASNAAAVIAAAAASNIAQIKAAQVNPTTVGSIPIMSGSTISNENSQGSDIRALSFSNNSTPVTSPVYGGQMNPLLAVEQPQVGSIHLEQDNQSMTNISTTSGAKQPMSDDESVGQKVQMLLDQAAAASSQTNSTEETITLHSAQGQQTLTINPDNLPQTFTIHPHNVMLKQPNRHWQEQSLKGNNSHNSVHSNSQSPRSDETSPNYYQQVSPISPPVIQNSQMTPQSPVIQQHSHHRAWNTSTSPGNADKNGEDMLKPAECSICERTFKNVQALNGHMRCHGGYFKKEPKEPKEDKKSKKSSKEMAPPKTTAPKGSKPIAAMPHPLDQVGSPQSGAGSTYGSQMQSPVSGESSVGSEASVMILQQPGYEQLQQDQMQIQQQQQIQGEFQQQQLQQQLQLLQMEQVNVETKILQLKEQLQQQNQKLTQQQEQSIQHELQLQSNIQQQLQQLQVDSIQFQTTQQFNTKPHDAQNILHNIHNSEGRHDLNVPEQKVSKPPDIDLSILHNLQQPTSSKLLQAYQQNLAKQEADRQLHDIQQVLKQEAESLESAHPMKKQTISKEEMEKHLINKLFLQASGGIPVTDIPIQQQLEQHKRNVTPPQSQHVKQSERPQQVLKQGFSGHLPTLIHHHPQNNEPKSETASVPTSQVNRSLHLQRQVSFEDFQNHPLHNIGSPSPQKITDLQLQQLLQQRNDTLNCQPRSNNIEDTGPIGMRHMDLSPPPITLTPTSIQSNLQTAIAQIPQFALKTPTEIGNSGQSIVSVPLGLKLATTESQDLSLILETIGSNFQKPSLSNAKTLPPHSLGQENVWLSNPGHNRGRLTDAKKSTINYSQMSSEKRHGLEKFFEQKNVPLMDSAGHKVGSEHPLYKPEARKPENNSKAAEHNPFAFPGIDGNMAQNDFTRPIDNINNPKHHRHKLVANQHTELKRRLSGGTEFDINATTSVLSGMLNNNKGLLSSAKSIPISSVTYNQSSVKPRMRSKSGDDYKYFRSKSEDHTFMRPRSQTEECLWKYKTKSEDCWDHALSKSDGAGLFRNPNMLTSPLLRMKRKHRPAPLFIPGHGNAGHGSFQSRLRSPRILTGEHKGNTPPPYTPPPMLSPNRSGSGLFWSIHKPPSTPMTAPVTPRTSIMSLSRSNSLIGSSQDLIPSEDKDDNEAIPETDILPHVNIGSMYQAEIPPYNSKKKDALKTISKEDLVFDPKSIGECSEEDVQHLQDFSRSAAVRGNGCNVEYCLHLLHLAKGNLQKAMLMLMENTHELPANHTLLSYTYQENDVWSTAEVEKYISALLNCDKDFYKISKEVGTKSVKECVQFYYLWKKVCPDENKRLRIVRRKREHERLYNLRSQQQQQQQQQSALTEQTEVDMEMNEYEEDSGSSTDMDEPVDEDKDDDASSINTSAPPSVATSPAPMFTCDYPECNAAFNSKQALNGHIRVHGGGPKSNSPAREYRPPSKPPKQHGSPANLEDLNGEGFPCKLCGRVFAKVRSRSAHMKSHRMNDSDKKPVKKTVPVLDNLIPKMSSNG